jgi:hypothetical protein
LRILFAEHVYIIADSSIPVYRFIPYFYKKYPNFCGYFTTKSCCFFATLSSAASS